jgi:hypothetical protein
LRKTATIPDRPASGARLALESGREAMMFRAKPAIEVGVLLEEATTAFDRCLQALRSGDAPTARGPRGVAAAQPAKAS